MTESTKTEIGNVFISNYPPYSQWKPEHLPEVTQAMAQPPVPGVPLGLYLHIPFCRKRCKFCYFKVLTDQNAQQIESYVEALSREIELISQQPVMGDRPFRFVYFGGGTPSFLSSRQLVSLVDRLQANIRWDQAEEVTFECEPGTLQEKKIQTLKALGVTRISLGVESFSDEILKANGRAHLSGEIYRCWDWIQNAQFQNVNIDLISGMVGETWDNWKKTIAKAIELGPDSVTIYQMELPFNTLYSKDILGNKIETPVADWETKRAWVHDAFDTMVAAGYSIGSAYTVVKDPEQVNFSYRDNLWHGADMLAAGIASFGHVSGVHYQNKAEMGDYQSDLRERNQLPLGRALRPSKLQLLIREMILLIKRGFLDADDFKKKWDVDILERWQSEFRRYEAEGLLVIKGPRIELTRNGLLQVDAMLPAFFEPEYRGIRYT